MIITLKDYNDLVYAYVEFEIVDKDTKLTDEGNAVYVQNIWIHKYYRHKKILKKLIEMIFEKSNKAEYVYWRTNKNGRVSPLHCISKLLRFTRLREVI